MKKNWIVGMCVAAAAAFVGMSFSEPARATAFTGNTGHVVSPKDDINDVTKAVNKMLADAKKTAISSEVTPAREKAAAHIYN